MVVDAPGCEPPPPPPPPKKKKSASLEVLDTGAVGCGIKQAACTGSGVQAPVVNPLGTVPFTSRLLGKNMSRVCPIRHPGWSLNSHHDSLGSRLGRPPRNKMAPTPGWKNATPAAPQAGPGCCAETGGSAVNSLQSVLPSDGI